MSKGAPGTSAPDSNSLNETAKGEVRTVIADKVTMKFADGATMQVRRWAPTGRSADAVVALHGLTGHAGRFYAVGECLAKCGIAPLRAGPTRLR